MSHSVEKLPKWAQELFANLEMRLAEAKDKLRTMAGTPDTLVAVNEGPWEESGALFWAPSDASVRFFFEEPTRVDPKTEAKFVPQRRWRSIEIRLSRDNQSIHVSGSQCLTAEFSAGNVVTLGVKR